MSKIFQLIRGVLFPVTLAWLITGCATTVDDRIQADRERYDAYPADIQANISEGRIEPGYSEDMVRMALGEPDRVGTRITEDTADEVWVYHPPRSRFTVGIGGSTGRRTSSVGIGTGVGVRTGARRGEGKRVIFEEGVVRSVEQTDAE